MSDLHFEDSNDSASDNYFSNETSDRYDVNHWAMACLCTTLVVSIVGNSLVIVAFVKDRRLRVLFNLLAVHLAVADISIGIVLMFTAILEFARLSYLFDFRLLCQTCAVLANALPTEQLIITHLMCNNRHHALQHGLSYIRHTQPWHTQKLILFITWTVSLAAGFLMTDVMLAVHPTSFHSCHFPHRLFYVSFMSYFNALLLLVLLVALICIIRDFWPVRVSAAFVLLFYSWGKSCRQVAEEVATTRGRHQVSQQLCSLVAKDCISVSRRLRRMPLPFVRLQDVEADLPGRLQPQEERASREDNRSSKSIIPRSPIPLFSNFSVAFSSETEFKNAPKRSTPCPESARTKIFDSEAEASPPSPMFPKTPETEAGSREESTGNRKSPRSLTYYSLKAISPNFRAKVSELTSLNLSDLIRKHQEGRESYRGQENVLSNPVSLNKDDRNVPERDLENDAEDISLSVSICSADAGNAFVQHDIEGCLENVGKKNRKRNAKVGLTQESPKKIKSVLGKGKNEIRKNVRIVESDKKVSNKGPDDAADDKPDELEGKVINAYLIDDIFVSSTSLSDDELTEFPLPRFRPRTDSLYTLRSRLSISEESVTDLTITDEMRETSVRSDDSASVEESEMSLKNVKGRRDESKLFTIGDDEEDLSSQLIEHNVKGKSDSLRTLLSCYCIPGELNPKDRSESSPTVTELRMKTVETGKNDITADASDGDGLDLNTVSAQETGAFATSPPMSPGRKRREEAIIYDNTHSPQFDKDTAQKSLKGCVRYQNEEAQRVENTHDDDYLVESEILDADNKITTQTGQQMFKSDEYALDKAERNDNSSNQNNSAVNNKNCRLGVEGNVSKCEGASKNISESNSKLVSDTNFQGSASTGSSCIETAFSQTELPTVLPAQEMEQAVKDWISFYGVQVVTSMITNHSQVLQPTKQDKNNIKSLTPRTMNKKRPEMFQMRALQTFTNTNGIHRSARPDLNSIEAQIDGGIDIGHSQRDIDLAVESWIAFYDISQCHPPGHEHSKVEDSSNQRGDRTLAFEHSGLFLHPTLTNEALKTARKIWMDFYDIQAADCSTQTETNSENGRLKSVTVDVHASENESPPGATGIRFDTTEKQRKSARKISVLPEGPKVMTTIVTNVDETGKHLKSKPRIAARVEDIVTLNPLSKDNSSQANKSTTQQADEDRKEGGGHSCVCKPLMLKRCFSFSKVSEPLAHSSYNRLRSFSESHIKRDVDINCLTLVEQPFSDWVSTGSFTSPDKAMELGMTYGTENALETPKKKVHFEISEDLDQSKFSDTLFSELVLNQNHGEINGDVKNFPKSSSPESNVCNMPRKDLHKENNISKSQFANLSNTCSVEIPCSEVHGISLELKVPGSKTTGNGTHSVWDDVTKDYGKENDMSTVCNGKNIKSSPISIIIPGETALPKQTKTETTVSTCPVNGKETSRLRLSPKEILENLNLSRRAFLVELGIYQDILFGLIPLNEGLLRFKVEDGDESSCPYCVQRLLKKNMGMRSSDNLDFNYESPASQEIKGERENSTNNSQTNSQAAGREQAVQRALNNNITGASLEGGHTSRHSNLMTEMISFHESDSLPSLSELSPQERQGTNCLCTPNMKCEIGTFERLKLCHPKLSILISLALIIFGQLICWLPITVLYMYYDIKGFPAKPTNQELAFITLWCARMALQPMFYAVYSKNFRETFVKLLSCGFSR